MSCVAKAGLQQEVGGVETSGVKIGLLDSGTPLPALHLCVNDKEALSLGNEQMDTFSYKKGTLYD